MAGVADRMWCLPKVRIAVLSGFTITTTPCGPGAGRCAKARAAKDGVLVPPGAPGPLRQVWGPGPSSVKKGSLRGFTYLAVAKYVFFTHDLPGAPFARDVVATVNVWHGMPVKRVGWMNNEGPLVPITRYRWRRRRSGPSHAGVAAAPQADARDRTAPERSPARPGPRVCGRGWAARRALVQAHRVAADVPRAWEDGTHTLGVAAGLPAGDQRAACKHGAVAGGEAPPDGGPRRSRRS